MKTVFTLFILFFSTSVNSDDITDFEIEGISIGNSLLKYMSLKQIKSEIEWSKNFYYYKNTDFAEAYLYETGEKYDYLSFLIKPSDNNYLIYGIYGNIDNDINVCLKMKKEIVGEFKLLFPSTMNEESVFSPSFDKTGKSKIYYSNFIFETKDKIVIECYDYSKELEIENNVDGLSVSILSHETDTWLQSRLN